MFNKLQSMNIRHVSHPIPSPCRFLQQRGWRNDEINARIERIEADSSGVEEDEGLYATYAMLHTYRNE